MTPAVLVSCVFYILSAENVRGETVLYSSSVGGAGGHTTSFLVVTIVIVMQSFLTNPMH